MKDWLKDYFLCFFKGKYARNIYKRSFAIAFLNLILLFVTLFASTFLGQQATFKAQLESSEDFLDVASSAFVIDLIDVREEKLHLPYLIDTTKRAMPLFGSYTVIVDTRDSATTFDDFGLTFVNGNGNAISLDQYKALGEQDREAYGAVIERRGVYLDTVENLSTYEAYLSRLGDTEAYTKYRNWYLAGQLTEEEYADKLYVLYGESYYPAEVLNSDSYGQLPTMRSYYMTLINEMVDDEEYLLMLDDSIEGRFIGSAGAQRFYGDYSNNVGYDLPQGEERKSAIAEFLLSCYHGCDELRAVSYGYYSFFLWFGSAILFILGAFIIRLALRFAQPETPHYMLKIINLTGAFSLVPQVFVFAVSIPLALVVSRDALLLLIPISILLFTFTRAAIHYVKEKGGSDYVADKE